MTAPVQVPISPEVMKLLTASVKDVNFYQAGISEYGIVQHDDGTATIKDLNVFRSGTFKDSMGEQHTWPDEQMAQMASNFDNLRSKGILPNVPVREGHKSFFGGGGAVKGYVTGLKAVKGKLPDGTDTTFLKADFQLTEPDAVEKLQRGTYRARSAEVGMYEDNTGALHFPTFMGFAFVDIPAVEGLYSRAESGSPFLLISEDQAVTQPPTPPGTGEQKTEMKFTINGQEVTDPAAVQAYITSLEQSKNSASEGTVFEFTIGGQKVTDFAAVQRHIAGLEEFQKEAIEAGRKSFAKQMADTNRILASDLPNFEKKVVEMDPNSFEVLKTAMEFAQPHPVVGQQMAPGVTNTEGAVGNHSKSEIDDQIEIKEGVVKSLRHSAMTEEQIKKTNAYQELQALYAKKNATTSA